jgi:hypothetical protein
MVHQDGHVKVHQHSDVLRGIRSPIEVNLVLKPYAIKTSHAQGGVYLDLVHTDRGHPEKTRTWLSGTVDATDKAMEWASPARVDDGMGLRLVIGRHLVRDLLGTVDPLGKGAHDERDKQCIQFQSVD